MPDETFGIYATSGKYLYTFACHENERELCMLELSTLLEPSLEIRMDMGSYVWSDRCIPPGRSPFIHGRLDVIGEGSKHD